MSPAVWGAFLGAVGGCGVLLVATRLLLIRRPRVELRVLPYLRDLPQVGGPIGSVLGSSRTDTGLLGVPLRAAGELVEKVLGGATSVQRRLDRAAIDRTLHDFRVEQVLWGLIGFALAAAYGLLTALTNPSASAVRAVLVCLAATAAGVLLRDQHLTSQVKNRERRILAEFPTVAELLALSVAAGESPVTALDRVVRRSGGDLSADLAGVLADVRTGVPVGVAFDAMAATTGLPLVARFAQGIAVAVERGTPLSDVLHAQAADVREAGRRELIEVAARKEVLMMVPVVFLILPLTVVFAFWPGVVGLSLTAF